MSTAFAPQHHFTQNFVVHSKVAAKFVYKSLVRYLCRKLHTLTTKGFHGGEVYFLSSIGEKIGKSSSEKVNILSYLTEKLPRSFCSGTFPQTVIKR